jgi:hypothetical protein
MPGGLRSSQPWCAFVFNSPWGGQLLLPAWLYRLTRGTTYSLSWRCCWEPLEPGLPPCQRGLFGPPIDTFFDALIDIPSKFNSRKGIDDLLWINNWKIFQLTLASQSLGSFSLSLSSIRHVIHDMDRGRKDSYEVFTEEALVPRHLPIWGRLVQLWCANHMLLLVAVKGPRLLAMGHSTTFRWPVRNWFDPLIPTETICVWYFLPSLSGTRQEADRNT